MRKQVCLYFVGFCWLVCYKGACQVYSTEDMCIYTSSCPPYSTCENTPSDYHCTCKRGFLSTSGDQHFKDQNVKCNDVDECSQDPTLCDPYAKCTNVKGSFVCECFSGYMTITGASGKRGIAHLNCTDIDECLHLATCPDFSTCTNIPGAYYCACREGFASDSGKQRFTDRATQCNDVDECSQDPTLCGPHANCTNTKGSFVCECFSGYESMTGASGKQGIAHLNCADIDECLDSTTCPVHSTCTNIQGGHYCACKDGFASSSGEQHFTDAATQCNDIDECLHSAKCPGYSTCTNTLGGHYCACKDGFASSSGEQRFTDPGAQCNDVDECSQDPKLCGPHANCTNTKGSFVCECFSGYKSMTGASGKQGTAQLNCTDINECLDSTTCPVHSTCTNIQGGHYCACKDGFASSSGEQRFTDAATQCNDVDECSQDPTLCGPHANCTNTKGSFVCECFNGYTTMTGASGKQGTAQLNCTDINECLHSTTCPVHSTCTNIQGGHYCACKDGFASSSGEQRFTDPGAQCNDVDECSQDPTLCGPHAKCTNTNGSFVCECLSGYKSVTGASGKLGIAHLNCTDVDECSQDPSPCGSNSLCTNKLGSYGCMCEPGYLPLSRPGIPFSCREVAIKCRSDFSRENDLVRRCQNPGRDMAHGSSTNDAASCILLNSTFSVLGGACERKNSTVSLKEAAGGFASVLKQMPSWSNLSVEQVVTTATVFLQSVESIALAVFASPTENGSQSVQTDLLDIQTKVIQGGCSSKDTVFHLEAKGETMEINCGTVQGSVAQGLAGVAFASYVGMESILNSSFFQDQSTRSVQMNSRVVGAFLTSQTKSNFPDPVSYTFQNILPVNSSSELICVSWESTAQHGSWSRAGCRVLHINATHTKCGCNHVSNLAILMASGEMMVDFPLFLLSHIGLSLSLLCLLLAILTFLLCRSIRNVNTSIHLHLCLCLFLADLLFLTAVDRTSHQLACAVVAGLLHYLFLACFTWMFLEAVVLFLTVRNLGVVNYFSTHSPNMWILSLFGYGFPALVVAISAAVMAEGYGRQENCWLSTKRGFIWSFLGPVCAIIGINSVLFALTLWILQRKLSSLNSEVSTLKDTRLLTFKAIAQVFILGCTWIFGLLQVGPAAIVMAYLFTIINSLQGAFIFLVHCLLNRQVREEYKRWFTCKSKSYVSDVSMSTLATSSRAG